MPLADRMISNISAFSQSIANAIHPVGFIILRGEIPKELHLENQVVYQAKSMALTTHFNIRY